MKKQWQRKREIGHILKEGNIYKQVFGTTKNL